MLTSTILFFLGDSIAQFGIEGRKLSLQLTEDGTGESKVGEDSGEDGKWDVSAQTSCLASSNLSQYELLVSCSVGIRSSARAAPANRHSVSTGQANEQMGAQYSHH